MKKKSELKPNDHIDKCFVCGTAFVENSDDANIISSRSEKYARNIDSHISKAIKLNYLLFCPNCRRSYCVKHESMLLRDIGKCQECQKLN